MWCQEVICLGDKPVLKGTLSVRVNGVRVTIADVSLWFVDSDKSKSPFLNGCVSFKRDVKAGSKFYVSLFE